MEVIINGDIIDIKGKFNNIRDIIDKLIEIVHSNRRTITSISIDEKAIDQSNDSFLNVPYTGQNIYVTTEETDKVLERSIRESIEYIQGSLLSDTLELSMSFREGKSDEVAEKLSQIIDSFYWLLDLVDFMAKHGIFNETDIKLNDFQISDFISFLKEIMDAQDSKDYVLVADLLEYEIKPLIEKWLELFNHLNEII